MNVKYDSEALTDEAARFIRRQLTAALKETIQTIHQNSGIQHMELARRLDIQVNALSNRITKIKAIDPPLLDIRLEKQSKYYTLTSIAEQYIKQENADRDAPSSYSAGYDPAAEALRFLEQFQTVAGSKWIDALRDMLTERNAELKEDPLHETYHQFLNALFRVHIKQTDAAQQIYDKLPDSILVRDLKEKMSKRQITYYQLAPLFALEKENVDAAFYFIDRIFAQFKGEIYTCARNADIDEADLFSDTQYNDAYVGISSMSSEFTKESYDKQKARRYWSYVSLSQNASLLYIIEKCSVIQMLSELRPLR